uniref:Uncharacterized protein n=1 Tax=Rhodosorus marinus TaxID=101924 RepID=A0A7S3ABA8_9RHOD|mmetsp:Transcript_7853/g.34962  ORF Transcript_7853/g.34962 Transcript_7853/m.34962 type:complete len:122 (+) Transcript_7853:482-847(+)
MKEGRNGNIKADEVKRAYFSANPPETNEAHDLEEDELEANSSMVRRQTLASRYGATNIEEISKQAVQVQRVNSNPVHSNQPETIRRLFLSSTTLAASIESIRDDQREQCMVFDLCKIRVDP